jgi:hypothetical protein
MVAIFEDMLKEPDWKTTAGTFLGRVVPDRASTGAGLDGAVAVSPSSPGLMELIQSWGSRFEGEVREHAHQFAMSLLNLLHGFDVERASKPPVIEMVVTPQAGTPSLPPGKYRVETGPQRVVAFTPSLTPPDSTSTDMPVYVPPRARGSLTGRLRDFLNHAPG